MSHLNNYQKHVLRSLHLVFCLFFITTQLVAQISINSDDILGLLGTSQTIEFDLSEGVSVDVGMSGENQEWDFSQQLTESVISTIQYINPENTPFFDQFPSSNFGILIIDSSDMDVGIIQLYEYAEVSSTAFSNLGGAGYLPVLDTFVERYQARDIAPLPLTFGSEWQSFETDTFNVQGLSFISVDTASNRIDAWGTVKIPGGTFECLRIRSDNRHIETVVNQGLLITSEEYNTIEYTWITKDHFIVAVAESQDDDIDPNFTSAQHFQRFVGQATTSFEQQERTIDIRAYPNPFTDELHIEFPQLQNEMVQIDIVNSAGQVVATYPRQSYSSKSIQLSWPGQKSVRGSTTLEYFVRIHSQNQMSVIKLLQF